MKILFDTNIILDVLPRREPFFQDAASLFAHVELEDLRGYLGATTVTTLYYFMAKALGTAARHDLESLLELFDVVTVNARVLENAIISPVGDYEDAVLVEAALFAGLDGIVTRNTKDFSSAPLNVFTPKELLKTLTTG